MQPRLVRVGAGAAQFAALLTAARAAGLRLGWLDLASPCEAPVDLARSAAAGALRAVALTDRTVVSVKTLAGAPVVRDLVREHFTGCRLLLVRGDLDAPELSSHASGWRLRWPDGRQEDYTTDGLLRALRRPRFP